MAASEDAECLDTWEEMEVSGVLDQKLNNLKIQSTNVADLDSVFTERKGASDVILVGEEAFRTQYVPPEPTVKILKRPTQNSDVMGNGAIVNGDVRPARQPFKTLQQREQEYAEARLRILGEARSPEENTESKSKAQGKLELLRSPEMAYVVRLPKEPDGTRGFHLQR